MNEEKLVVSLEYMKLFENDPTVSKLITAIDKLRMGGDLGTKTVKESQISELINDRFGTNVTLIVTKGYFLGAAIEMPPVTNDHPFYNLINPTRGNDVGRLLTNFGERGQRIGKINLDTGKLSGVFSKIPSDLIVDESLLKDMRFTTRNIVAIMLHEIGHVFFYYYFMLNTTLATFITTKVAAEAAGAKSDTERKVIFDKGAKILGIDGIGVTTMLGQDATTNATELQAIYINETRNYLRSETGYSLYEIKINEQLADYFPSRFGLAYDLADGLEKIFRYTGNRATIPKISNTITNISVVVLGLTVAAVTLGAAAPLMLLLLNGAVYDSANNLLSTYDRPKDRIESIKKNLIQELKQAESLNKKQLLSLIEQVDKLSAISDRLFLNEKLTDFIANRVIPFSKNVKKQIEFQKTIEDLLYNEIFVKAAKFHSGEMK